MRLSGRIWRIMQIWEVPSLWRTERERRLMQNEAEFLIFNLLSKEYACVNKEISKEMLV